ncbi:MAG: hypothetical protein IJT87_10470 [Ruminiclostridium sp.]|nr:hypothetical protein [Ruminiclostridium sp.]
MNSDVFTERERRFIDLIKSRMSDTDTREDLEVVVFPAILSLDGENDNPIFEDALTYVEEHPEATLRQIGEYIISLLPPIEIVDDDEESA